MFGCIDITAHGEKCRACLFSLRSPWHIVTYQLGNPYEC